MPQQVTINVRADVSDAQQSIRNAIAELKGLAAAANEGSAIAQNAFRSEAAEVKAFAASLGASAAQLDQINATTQQFENRVASLDRTTGRMASSGARSFSILATQSAVSTRSVDQLINSTANLALGMTGAAGFIAAGAIAVFGIARAFQEARDKAEKLREEMDKLAFDDSFSESANKQHQLQLEMIADSRKLSEARVREAFTNAALGGSLEGLVQKGLKLIGQDPVSRAEKALKAVQDQLTQINALVDKQAAEEDTREKAHQKVLDDEEAARKRIAAARKQEEELARLTLEHDKEIAKFARDLPLDMHFANEQAVNPDVTGAAEAAPGSRTRPMHFTAPHMDAMQKLTEAIGKVGVAFLLMGNKADEAFTKTNRWVGVVTTSLMSGMSAGIQAIVSGKGNLKQVEQALAEPWIKSLEARAEYDLAMAGTNWMNPAIAGKYLASAAADIAGAAAISRILDMGGSSNSSSGSRGSGGAGASAAQLGIGPNAQYQQPVFKVVVTGNLTMDGRTVANLNGKLQRVNDRGAPVRAVL